MDSSKKIIQVGICYQKTYKGVIALAEKTLLVSGGGQEDVRITISHSSKFQVDIWTKEIKAMFKGLRVEEVE